VMLLDWIGAGSEAVSNPVQKVRSAGSRSSNTALRTAKINQIRTKI
jgi:ribose 5-phosphate isomerase RpiB